MEEKKEINLFELIIILFKGLKSLFKKTINLFCQTLRLSVQYCWIIAAVMVLSAFYLFYAAKNSSLIYKSNTVITFASENKLLVINELNAINSLASFDRVKFAEALNITVEQAKFFKEIRNYSVIDFLNDSIADIVDMDGIYKLSDTLNRCMPNYLGIEINLSGSRDFAPYYEGLAYYFNNQKNILRADSASRVMLAASIAFCDKELERLNNFSNYDYFGSSEEKYLKISPDKKNRGGIVLESSQKHLYYVDRRNLQREKKYLTDIAAKTPSAVNFLSENPTITVYSSKKNILLSLISAYIVGVLLAFAFKRKKIILDYFKNRDY